MQKLTLSFVNANGNIPGGRIPLTGEKSISAIIDTGPDSAFYGSAEKEKYPEMASRSSLAATRSSTTIPKLK